MQLKLNASYLCALCNRILSMTCQSFRGNEGIIHHEFVSTGQTVTGEFYLEVLHCLMARIRRIRPEYSDPEDWLLVNFRREIKPVCWIIHRIRPT